jgi:hypothetical protein
MLSSAARSLPHGAADDGGAEEDDEMDKGVKSYEGACHCGAVRFAVDMDLGATNASKCNCSICTKLGVTGGVVKPAAFKLEAGEGELSTYAFGTKMATRYFCKRCGVHLFGKGHLAELGGDFVSVNVNTLEGVEPTELELVYWDGRHDNWQIGPRKTPFPVLGAAIA